MNTSFLDTALKAAELLAALGVPAVLAFIIRCAVRAAKRTRTLRQKETVLILKGIQSTGQLAYAAALAVKGERLNGEMDLAIRTYGKYSQELDAYLTEQAVGQTH